MSEPARVGIFWRLDRALLVDCVPLADAEPYGEHLTHGGHHEHWTMLAAMNGRERRALSVPETVCWTEYDDWPRGRVVFHQPTARFTVYADRTLQTPSIIAEIVRRFSLPSDRTDVRSDAHYVLTHRR